MSKISRRDRFLGGLWGSLVGDALGVPVEFIDRASVQSDPVTDMREFGTHHQPRGTWSDDGALILCTTDSLLHHEFDPADMGARFVRWMNRGLWTAGGEAFDVGCTTMDSLLRIEKGAPAELAGGQSEDNNGNGSLMRILPASLRFATDPFESFVEKLERASAITHAHARSKMGCVFYGLLVRELLGGQPASEALKLARTEFVRCYERAPELPAFRHLLENSLDSLPEDEVLSTGYVLHTLHASLWCLLTTRNFRDAVLKAVNLGGDTDTTGCVTGGLAGVTYGLPALPGDWINQLARKDDVDCLFREFADLCETPGAK